jgi:hypothetical protein
VIPGIAGNAKTAPKRLQQGFRLVEVASDIGLLGLAARDALEQVRPTAQPETTTAYL